MKGKKLMGKNQFDFRFRFFQVQTLLFVVTCIVKARHGFPFSTFL